MSKKKGKKALKTVLIILAALVLAVAALAIYNQIAMQAEKERIVPNGTLIDAGGYNVHVYSEGENAERPVLVFLSGSATVAPVYDFKPLYSLLSGDYRIAVVEKAGYGYSDIVEVNRDVDTMVNEVRGALAAAGVQPPYVLLPHSMSGLEALYWAQKHPDETAGIIGMDMAVQYSYDDFDFSRVDQMITFGGTAAKLGLLRIPGIYPLNTKGLTDAEIEQQRLLMYRNAVNLDYIIEGKAVYANAQTVKSGGNVACPVMLLTSNGKEVGDFWLPTQSRFAEENDARLVSYDCGHYLHYYMSEEMAKEIKAFVEEYCVKAD